MIKKIVIDNKETNYSVTSDGKVFNDITGKELKGTYKANEYQRIQLVIDGKSKSLLVHRLVAQAFCYNPNPEEYTIVDHIDGDKYNNNYTNLRWVNSKQNAMNRKTNERLPCKEYYFGEIDNSWKPIKGFENYLINKDGKRIINAKTKWFMMLQDRHGYKRVNLNGTPHSVHVLMWRTFVGEIPKGKVIDHIDGNKENNIIENLRLVSQSENMNNAYKNGHEGQIKISQYDESGKLIKEYNNISEAAREIGVTIAAVNSAALRHGTCKGYYWVREDDNTPIQVILTEWIPKGFVQLREYPTYCINKEGQVYNKRSKKILDIKYRPSGSYVNIGTDKRNIDYLLSTVNFEEKK